MKTARGQIGRNYLLSKCLSQLLPFVCLGRAFIRPTRISPYTKRTTRESRLLLFSLPARRGRSGSFRKPQVSQFLSLSDMNFLGFLSFYGDSPHSRSPRELVRFVKNWSSFLRFWPRIGHKLANFFQKLRKK